MANVRMRIGNLGLHTKNPNGRKNNVEEEEKSRNQIIIDKNPKKK